MSTKKPWQTTTALQLPSSPPQLFASTHGIHSNPRLSRVHPCNLSTPIHAFTRALKDCKVGILPFVAKFTLAWLYAVAIQCWVMNPKLQINLSSGIPVTRQIVDNLRVLLVAKQIAAGVELPSVRRLAMELNVHFNTVADAYRVLAAEGWIELKHGRSARVIDRALPRPVQGATLDWRTRLKQLAAQMLAAGIPNSEVANELQDIAKELMQCS